MASEGKKCATEGANGEMSETATTTTATKTEEASRSMSEVEEVECECCGLAEECTGAYIEHVRGLYCGSWVCGLCAEAVKEERGRGGGVTGSSIQEHQAEEEEEEVAQKEEALEESMADALAAHMSFCMQFNKPHKDKERSVADLVAAMRLLLRRSSSTSSPRSAPSTPRPAPSMHRSHSCLGSFPRAFQ